MDSLEWFVAWLLVTAAAAAVGVVVTEATGGDSRAERFSPWEHARVPPRHVRAAPWGLDTNRNPADAVPNGGDATLWTEPPEVPRGDYLYRIGA